MTFAKAHIESAENCAVKIKDPTEDILAIVNELMSRGGMLASLWSNTTHLLDSAVSDQQTVIEAKNQLRPFPLRPLMVLWRGSAADIDHPLVSSCLLGMVGNWSRAYAVAFPGCKTVRCAAVPGSQICSWCYRNCRCSRKYEGEARKNGSQRYE